MKRTLFSLTLFGLLCLPGFGCAGNVSGGKITPADLRCEWTQNPLGVDIAQPRLSWSIQSGTRGQFQTAFQILAASSARLLAGGTGDLWDSGVLTGDETIQILYNGEPLKSSQQVFWKVRVWDKDSKPSAWSRPASWTMGLLNEDDWHARWIGDDTNSQTLLLRREFSVKPKLKRAIAFVCGLGQYEMSLNGRKIGDDLLSPGWTKYNKTCLYDTLDVTAFVRPGHNAIGLLLGNGMYNVKGGRYTKFTGSFGPLKAICHVRLEYDDGSIQTVCTDDSWRVRSGPITFSSIYGGEDYDVRLEPKGWNHPDFNDADWASAKIFDGPGGQLRGLSAAAPPIRAFDVLKPIRVARLRPNTTVYDLGQNASVIPRLTVTGQAGSIVKIIPAELLTSGGSVDRSSCAPGGAPAYWQYTLDGSGSQTWFPKFFYHGCRYLQVVCTPAETNGVMPVVKSLEGVVVHSASPAVGEFACSNDLFNRIHTLIRWAQRSNMMSVITDCPHRERLGWLEQVHLNGPSLRYEFDLTRLFTKVMNDMADAQLENGLIPDTAPEYTIMPDGFRDSPEWGSAYIIAPWQQYLWTGDSGLLNRHYDNMKRYLGYLTSRADNNIVSYGLGDWYDLGPRSPGIAQLTPVALTATAFYYYDTWVMAQVAELLGKTDDSKQFRIVAGQIRDAFNSKFYDPNTKRYAAGSQAANAIPLVMNLVVPENRDNVFNALVVDLQNHGNANTAGDVGYRYVLLALAENGKNDLIFAMNNQSDKPGYGYQLKKGATSLTEAWNAARGSSQNHFMLGQIMEWFYNDLAGIGIDPAGPGFKKIIIYPQPVGDIKWVKGSYNSIRGKITSEWKRDNGRFTLKVTIPANTIATVFVPAKLQTRVTESGVPAQDSPGVKFTRFQDDRMIYTVGSGKYEFDSSF
jgi:alpha-L-rhamnosidase